MKIIKIKVKNCRNCPFSDFWPTSAGGYANCLAPTQIHGGDYIIDTYYKQGKSPKWCPLKKNKISIAHK